VCSVWHSGYLCTWLLLCGLFVEFLGELAKLRKATMSFVMSLLLFAWNISVATDGFSWNLIYEYCSKLCRENSSVIKIWKEERVLYIKNNIHLWSYLAYFFLVWEMLQAIVVEEIKTHILLSITFPRKSCRLLHNVEKYCGAGQAIDDKMAHTHCMLGN